MVGLVAVVFITTLTAIVAAAVHVCSTVLAASVAEARQTQVAAQEAAMTSAATSLFVPIASKAFQAMLGYGQHAAVSLL